MLRVPLIISVPGQKRSGQKTDGLVELVDVYPTLVEAAGLPPARGLEGTSFMPLVANPKREWKKAAFSQFTHRRPGKPRSIRTARYRYVEYTTGDKELYDFDRDPLGAINIAKRPEMADVIAELSKMLHDGWRAALPAGVKSASAASAE